MNRVQKRRRRRRSQNEEFQWDAAERITRRTRNNYYKWNRTIYGVTAGVVIAGLLIGVIVFQLPDHPEEDYKQTRIESIRESFGAPPATPEARSEAVIAELLGFINDSTHAARVKRMYGQADAMDNLSAYYDQRGNTLPRKVVNPSVNAVKFRTRHGSGNLGCRDIAQLICPGPGKSAVKSSNPDYPAA